MGLHASKHGEKTTLQIPSYFTLPGASGRARSLRRRAAASQDGAERPRTLSNVPQKKGGGPTPTKRVSCLAQGRAHSRTCPKKKVVVLRRPKRFRALRAVKSLAKHGLNFHKLCRQQLPSTLTLALQGEIVGRESRNATENRSLCSLSLQSKKPGLERTLFSETVNRPAQVENYKIPATKRSPLSLLSALCSPVQKARTHKVGFSESVNYYI